MQRSQSRRRWLALCLLPVLLAAFTPRIYADDLDKITFTGVVRDSAGAIVEAARINIKNVATSIERVAQTDNQGRYKLVVLEPGIYEIRVTASGFKPEERNNIETTSGRKINLDFSLVPATIAEQVQISEAAAPLIDTSRTVVGETITRRELEGLPIVDRDPLQLVFLTGGATEAPLSTADLADEGRGIFLRRSPEEIGLFSLTGAPSTSNNITIDGLDNNDDRAARERLTLPPDQIAELQIITNQYAAEYGRASGGRVNLRTRGGTKSYHGDAYFYFGDESLNANSYFRNARGLKRVPQSQYREGATFSGAIPGLKHFFFAGFERRDVTDSVEVNTLVPVQQNPRFLLPTPNAPVVPGAQVGLLLEEVSTPESVNTANLRVDFRFSDSYNAAVRFDLSRGANKRGFPGGTRLADTALIAGRNSFSLSYSSNYIFSANRIGQFRVQTSRLTPRSKSALNVAGVEIEDPGTIVAGSYTGSESSPAFAREETRTQLQANYSFARNSHLIKIGYDGQFIFSNFDNLFATYGQYTFDTVTDFLANRPSRFIQRFDTQSSQQNIVTGVFVQDEWKVKPNFTVSYGLRYDNESILKDRSNLSPRVSFAWDPFANSGRQSRFFEKGTTLIRAGFGIFFNRALLRTLDDFALGKSTTTVDSKIFPQVLSLVQFPNAVQDRSRVQQFALVETDFLRRVSPDLEIPYTMQTGLGIEKQLAKNLLATADYIFTRGVHLWRETNINAPRLPAGVSNFTDYLLSRDFDNRPVNGTRPIAGVNADVVRFDTGANTSSTSGAIRVINGVRILTLGVNAPRSSNILAATRAVKNLRPDPLLTDVELLEATGNSFYHAGIFSVRYRLTNRATFRAVYTLSKFIDEGTTNTASPQDLADRRAERALSLQDQRHRFVFSGVFQTPGIKLDLSPILAFGSARPFNIGSGFDRNLNDISNDRPNFIQSIGRPVWRKPGEAFATDVQNALRLAPIGSNGNLPRNYGIGPGTFTFNLRASRNFLLSERLKLRTVVDAFNVLNRTTYSFGAEFIDRDDRDFLTPRRTQRPRIVQLSLKLDF